MCAYGRFILKQLMLLLVCLVQFQRELAAEAAGVQFISAVDLKDQFSSQDTSFKEEESSLEETEHSCEAEATPVQAEGIPVDENQKEATQTKSKSLDPTRKGTEVKLLNLQLKENAAALQITKLALLIQCSRCKSKTELSTPGNRTNKVCCGKCNQTQLAAFRPALAHQFSAVVGFLDLEGCSAFDLVLVDSVFAVACLNCNKEMKIEVRPP